MANNDVEDDLTCTTEAVLRFVWCNCGAVEYTMYTTVCHCASMLSKGQHSRKIPAHSDWHTDSYGSTVTQLEAGRRGEASRGLSCV